MTVRPFPVLIISGIFSFTITHAAQKISFSMPHGLYSAPIEVSLSADNPVGTSIHYTTDGRVPCPSDSVYNGPVTINETTILRAAIYADGISDGNNAAPVSDVATASYLFVSSILSQSEHPQGYPSVWGPFICIPGNAPADYGMDQELLSDSTFCLRASQGLYQLPIVSVVTDPDCLFSHDMDEQKGGIYIYTGSEKSDGYGRGWERPASIEIFGTLSDSDVQADCGIRIHGGCSRVPEKNPKHSFRIVFRSEYGPGKVQMQLFGNETMQPYNSLVLRTFSNNSWQHFKPNRGRAQYMREMWARETQRQMGHGYIRAQYVHLFLNGMYWGMYLLSERPDDKWCSSAFGGSAEDYDVYKDGELFKGSDDRWNTMVATVDSIRRYSLLGLRKKSDRILDRLELLLDVDSFIDYMLLNFYAGNTDWETNWAAYANRKEKSGFRFLCWDSELVFGSMGTVSILSRGGVHRQIFHKLMYNRTFRKRFKERVYLNCYNNGPLTPESVMRTWNELYSRINLALYTESARWGDYRRDVHPYVENTDQLYTPDNQFAAEYSRLMEEYFPHRTEKLIKQLRLLGIFCKRSYSK